MPELAPDAPAPTAPAGRHFRVRDHYEVGREKIREFARAVQNDHPAHRWEADAGKLGCDGIVAPPTFASVVGMTTTQALLDTVLTDYDLSQILQTDQVFEIHRPMVAGDRLSSEAEIVSIRRMRGNDFIVVKATVTDEQGSVVQVGTTTIVARLGAEVDPDIVRLVEGLVMHRRDGKADPEVLVPISAESATAAPELADSRREAPVHAAPSFDDVAVGDELPALTMQLTRGDLVNYAGVSGDSNPIHFSDRAAELAGLPTVVAHGMLTMGLGAQYLTSWLEDPTAIETYSVRFSGFVPVEPLSPAQIEFTGRIKSLDPERRTATVLLGGTSAGKKLFGRAMAQVRLA
ncbi:MaoC family dehydratase N-terminal domain-containing protein [Nocardia terpenica]|uniref:(R)-hydratase n=1 Tax=Nocardia terpenica TaxID=455432 RepID=A0A164K905_9NOCA|nr:fused (3R)-hydroxyacyl-ACP dehydratase subunits HadA/HadB [Nocardia terpenica]KZM71162.1 (R)-hydratase [Nocardia terpenica]MBF6062717.1 MaoC family dehydratase N-terminal domain-containing protein [Nocardia terpenica]MBF6105148.1 MaoC family dehydratase N-terminal domain-containing protein [Nocardia terpenica]MBF6112415.1 MaoC family dehydratase N-terminal domain-containing protein [Nocardia terpenica]MBF6118876.1 MaoC family dehydratase N-terminal domain-containing protein [Nocardia terpen